MKKTEDAESSDDGQIQSCSLERYNPEQGIRCENQGKSNRTNYFEKTNLQLNQKLQQLKQKLLKTKFCVNQSCQNTKQVKLSILQSDGQSTIYRLSMGYFEGQLSVFRMKTNHNFYHDKEEAEVGGNGKVFHLQFEGQIYVGKLIYMKNFSEKILLKFLREIFYAKLFSQLEIGPRLYPLYGYDCIVFDDGVEFIMEKCQNALELSHILSESTSKSLEKSLQLMHLLQICHCDIKIMNIAWSKEKNKMVFLDFGFTQFILEKPGQKTQTNFIGSYHYCSNEMRKIYFLQKSAAVNLYQNDNFGMEMLQKELESLQNNFKKSEKEGQKQILSHQTSLEQIFFNSKTRVKSKKWEPQYEICSYELLQLYQFFFYLFSGQDKKLQSILGKNKNPMYLHFYGKILLYQWEITPQEDAEHKRILFSLYERFIKEKKLENLSMRNMRIKGYLDEGRFKNCISYIQSSLMIFAAEESVSKIGDYWGKEEWMSHIFNFILPSRDGKIKQEKYRKKIVHDLCLRLKPSMKSPSPQKLSFFEECHFILGKFFDYFLLIIRKSKINFNQLDQYLSAIKASFIYLGDVQKNEEIEKQLIQCYDDAVKKLEKIFEFFFEKIILYGKEHPFLEYKNDYGGMIEEISIDHLNQEQKKFYFEEKQKTLRKMNYLRDLIKNALTLEDSEPFHEKFEKFPIEEFNLMHRWSLENLYQQTGLFQQSKREAFIQKLYLSQFKHSKNVQASFFRSKMTFFKQGILSSENFLEKDPLFVIFKEFIEASFEKKQQKHLQYFQFFAQKGVQNSNDIQKLKEISKILINTAGALLNKSNFFNLLNENPEIKEAIYKKLQKIGDLLKDLRNNSHQIFQAISYEVAGKNIQAFHLFHLEYWRNQHQNRRFICISRMVALKSHCYGKLLGDLYNAVLHYKQKTNLLMSSSINSFLELSAATTQTFCFFGHQKLAFDHLKYDFKQISFQGKSKISIMMGANVKFLCKHLSLEKMTDIVRNTICKESLNETYLYRFQDFYFSFFFYSFHQIEKFLIEKQKKRFALIAVFGKSRFEYSLYFKAEAFVMGKLLELFPITSLRRKTIFQKRRCILERKLTEWEKLINHQPVRHVGYLFLRVLKSKIENMKKNLRRK